MAIRNTESADVSTPQPDSVSRQKFTEPLIDTPQSITGVPRFLIQDEGVCTLLDTLRNVPGTSLAAGESARRLSGRCWRYAKRLTASRYCGGT
jgi:catecholate siderophore receptor